MQSANHEQAGLATRSVPALNASVTGRFLLAVCASGFVAVCAHITVPLPFTPVPLTFSDFAVLLVGLALGPRMGFAALALYLAEGACGLPVFNPAGPGGVAQLFGQTGGYLIAYPLAAATAGAVTRRVSRFRSRFVAALGGCAIASGLIMICGMVWLGLLLHLTATRTFALGAAPFLPGQAIKVCAAAGIFASLVRHRRA